MAPEVVPTVVVAATLHTWVGVAGLVAFGIAAIATAAASAVYVRRWRVARGEVADAHYDDEYLDRRVDRSPEELMEAWESLRRQRLVLTEALAAIVPGKTSIVLAEQLGTLDRQLALLDDELRHARASSSASYVAGPPVDAPVRRTRE